MTKEEQNQLNIDLMNACTNGALPTVKELIEKGAKVDAKDPANGMTPLHYAADHGRLEVVKYLIEEANAEVDSRDQWQQTPLHAASGSGNLKVVKYLVEEAKADVEAHNKFYETPLYLAAQEPESFHLRVLEYLFLARNALMPIFAMFDYPKLMKEKMGRVTAAQSILDYFSQNKSKYKPEENQKFKEKFLDYEDMDEEDEQNLKPIVKFLH